MRLPKPRGPLSERVFRTLRGPVSPGRLELADECHPEDDALTLWVLHELHYRGFDDVDDDWEWSPATMPVRRRLEQELEQRLRSRLAASDARVEPAAHEGPVAVLRRLISEHDGASLAQHFQRHGTREQALEMLRQRSLYHLKEADPTTWVVPRLPACSKAALLEVQFDEYGDGDPARVHHRLFERGMEAAGLDSTYGRYVDEMALPVLEQNNALSMFGLQRRLRGAALGHLAAFEATSTSPSRRLVQGLHRLGLPEEMTAYYDEHVEADAIHEQLALRDVCGALLDEEPGLLGDVLFGAWTCLDLEDRTATHLLERWEAA